MKFFLNSSSKSYLRNLEQEFGDSSNSIRVELNKLEGAGLLVSETSGNRKYFSANTTHPLFPDIHNIIRKYLGIDRIIDTVVERLGEMKKLYLIGDFAMGKNGQLIDLLFVGVNINTLYLVELVEKAEVLIKRKIRFQVVSEEQLIEFLAQKSAQEYLLVYENS